jgi:hypothetical protein
MNKLELSNFGVEEMSQNEMVKTEGGGLLGGLLTSLLTAVSTVADDTLQYAGKQVKTVWTLLGSLL